MKKIMKYGMFLLVGGLILAQVVKPVDRSNPPVTGDVGAPAAVNGVLRRSCYDCHSNETTWPWYSYIAPFSWLVAGDVEEGREHLNFSEWDSYPAGQRDHKLEELRDEVQSGAMPLEKYTYLHRSAKLSDADKAALLGWAEAARAAIEAESSPAAGEPSDAGNDG